MKKNSVSYYETSTSSSEDRYDKSYCLIYSNLKQIIKPNENIKFNCEDITSNIDLIGNNIVINMQGTYLINGLFIFNEEGSIIISVNNDKIISSNTYTNNKVIYLHHIIKLKYNDKIKFINNSNNDMSTNTILHSKIIITKL
jgi:hypothetical protein